MKEFTLLPISSIDFIKTPLRNHALDSEEVIERAEDLKTNGMLNTPTVYKLSNGLTVLGDGATRFRSAQLLQSNGDTINGVPEGMFPCTVVDKSNDPKFTEADVLMAQINGNISITKTANKQFVDAIYNVQMATKSDMAYLSTKFGKSERHIRTLLQTVRLPEDIRGEIDNGISLTNAVDLEKVIGRATNKAVYGDDKTEYNDLVSAARSQTSEEFATTVAEFLNRFETAKAEAGKGKTKGEPTFTPTEKLMNREQLIALRDEMNVAGSDAEINLMKRIFNIDDAAIARQLAAWEAKRADAQQASELRKAASKKISEMSADDLKAELAKREAESAN